MNLLALPIFNLVTVPAALLGLLLSGPLAPLGDWLIRIAWKSVSVLLQAVAFASDIPNAELRIGNLGGIFLADDIADNTVGDSSGFLAGAQTGVAGRAGIFASRSATAAIGLHGYTYFGRWPGSLHRCSDEASYHGV